MKRAVACVVLAGCTPVSWWTSPSAIQTAAPALRRDGSATLVDKDVDERPQVDTPSPDTTETIRIDQPIGVRLATQAGDWSWVATQAQSPEHPMTIATLLTDCPPDLENTDANRREFPHCTLFRASEIRLRRGYHADRSDLIAGAILVGVVGNLTCAGECDRTAARVSVAVLGVGLVSAAIVGIYYWLDAAASKSYKH